MEPTQNPQNQTTPPASTPQGPPPVSSQSQPPITPETSPNPLEKEITNYPHKSKKFAKIAGGVILLIILLGLSLNFFLNRTFAAPLDEANKFISAWQTRDCTELNNTMLLSTAPRTNSRKFCDDLFAKLAVPNTEPEIVEKSQKAETGNDKITTFLFKFPADASVPEKLYRMELSDTEEGWKITDVHEIIASN